MALSEKLICPGGDILLVVGTPPEVKLLVSSTILCQSSVFQSMLNGPFREGNPDVLRSAAIPQEVSLPDDDVQAVADICSLLHQNIAFLDEMPWTAKRLYQLAAIMDKYDCLKLLRIPAQGLLLRYVHTQLQYVYFDKITLVAAAAYLLEDTCSFKDATRCLVREYRGSYVDTREHDVLNIIPYRALSLEVQRASARDYISTELPLLGMPECSHGCDNYDDHFMRVHLCKEFAINFWPPNFDDLTILEAVGILKESRSMDRKSKHCGHLIAKERISDAELRGFAADVEIFCEGLCLLCVKEEREDLEGPCTCREHNKSIE